MNNCCVESSGRVSYAPHDMVQFGERAPVVFLYETENESFLDKYLLQTYKTIENSKNNL